MMLHVASMYGLTLLFVDHGLDFLNGVRRLDLEGDGLAGWGGQVYWHPTFKLGEKGKQNYTEA